MKMKMKIIANQTARRALPRLALILAGTALSLGALLAQTQSASSAKPTKQSGKKTATQSPAVATAAAQDPGERKFQENCSRCHSAPEQISPRIAGTVLRHMRVRASLSAQDERDILRYLAP